MYWDVLPSLFAQAVIDAVHASSNEEELPHLKAGFKVFELGASRLDGKRWINVYARDVTAEDVIRRLPEKNPAAVFRVSTSGELLFGNPASASLLKFWA